MKLQYLVLFTTLLSSLAQFIPSDDRSRFEKLGLYLSNNQDRGLKAIPLQNMTINATIAGAYAYVELHQLYKNSYETPIETVYLFPRSETSVFDKFLATTKDKVIEGVIMEKQEARQKYEEHKAKGDTVAYAEIDSLLHDVMMLKLGNLPSGEEIVITFRYIQPLEVALNSFWRFTIYSTLTERYTPSRSITPEHPVIVTSKDVKYTWQIFVQIDSQTPLRMIKTPGYSTTIHYSEDNKRALITPYENQANVPNHDFVLLFRNDEIYSPRILVEKHPKYENDYIGLISFFPQLNQLSPQKAYEYLAMNPNLEDMAVATLDDDIATSRAEFIFITDRSGSMFGLRIENLVKAMNKFLDTLPNDSYFNVISFGSTFSLLFPQSVKTSPDTIADARSQIQRFDANYGGTEILQPIQAAVNLPLIEGYPRSIFLLTDGDVTNAEEIIKYVRTNSNNIRVCAVGIGNGISPYLLANVAKHGHCAVEFVRDEENIGEKALKLVQMSISHVLSNFKITITSEKKNPVKYTLPAMEKLPVIPKNMPFKMWVRFNEAAVTSSDSVKFLISCKNSFTGEKLEYEIPLDLSQAIEGEFFHKLETSEMIDKLMIENYGSYSYSYSNSNSNSTDYKKEIVALSLKYQVLSEETAFFALIKENAVTNPSNSQTIKIPNAVSEDYQSLSKMAGDRSFLGAGKMTLSLVFAALLSLVLILVA